MNIDYNVENSGIYWVGNPVVLGKMGGFGKLEGTTAFGFCKIGLGGWELLKHGKMGMWNGI
jgi:hypothetical protein